MENKFFPLFINFNNRECLVVGGGNIALRKIKTLLKYGAKVEVIALEIKEEIQNLKKNENLRIIVRGYREEDLKGKFLVVAATEREEINLKIVKSCQEKNILVNNITSKTEMNTRFCTFLDKEEYVIGISGKGNPKKALEMKEKIKNME